MLELSKREKDSYSIRSAINALMSGGTSKLEGLELECHQELEKTFPQKTGGVIVPSALFEMKRNWRKQRDLSATTFGSGGALVPTVVESEVIPVLRNKLCTQRLGMRVLSGLEGNVAIPRQTSPATVYSLAEQATLTKSNQTFDQVLLSPHRVGAYQSFTRQLVLQSSVDVENLLRDDLNKSVAVKIDALVLQGQGAADEPTGILNTTGIGSLAFGGAATWQELIAFESALARANADEGKLGWCVSTNTRGRWQQIAKSGVGVTSVVPIFLWDEANIIHDGTNDAYVKGYRAAATNNVLNDLVYFGAWDEACLGIFGDGLELIVDPYTQSTDATIRVTVNTFVDLAIRHAASFCVSSDAGNL